MYTAVLVTEGIIDQIISFEEFPVWLEGVGTVNSVSEVENINKANNDFENYVEVVEVSLKTGRTVLEKTLDWWRDVVKSRGAESVWLRTSIDSGEVYGYIVGTWPADKDHDDLTFEIRFDKSGDIIDSYGVQIKS